MGEKQNRPFHFSFNASLKVGFQVSRITSDGGLILVRELDQRLGFGELITQHLTERPPGGGKWEYIGLQPGGRMEIPYKGIQHKRDEWVYSDLESAIAQDCSPRVNFLQSGKPNGGFLIRDSKRNGCGQS